MGCYITSVIAVRTRLPVSVHREEILNLPCSRCSREFDLDDHKTNRRPCRFMTATYFKGEGSSAQAAGHQDRRRRE